MNGLSNPLRFKSLITKPTVGRGSAPHHSFAGTKLNYENTDVPVNKRQNKNEKIRTTWRRAKCTSSNDRRWPGRCAPRFPSTGSACQRRRRADSPRPCRSRSPVRVHRNTQSNHVSTKKKGCSGNIRIPFIFNLGRR